MRPCLAVLALAAVISSVPVASTAATSSKHFDFSVSSKTLATVALSASSFAWANITSAQTGSGGPTNLQSDNGPVTVTGSIRTSAGSGASSIVVMSPGNLSGSSNGSHQLNISQFSLTCAGSGNSGTQPTYVV